VVSHERRSSRTVLAFCGAMLDATNVTRCMRWRSLIRHVCRCRDLAFIYAPVASPDVVSPQGMHQSARMRQMRHLFDGGPLPTALDASMAALPSARPATAPRASPVLAPVYENSVGTHANEPCEGMWREEPGVTYRRGSGSGRCGRSARNGWQERQPPRSAAGRLQPLMVAIPEDAGSSAQASPPAHSLKRVPGARPGVARSPTGFTGRHFAGVQQLANLFETTRLSQVAPTSVSKVQALVRDYEGPSRYKRSARTAERRRA
jgi:hypothetical protein